MSDLNSQLRQAADEAAGQARPMAVADVISRGNRRRQRVIAQRSLSGLSAVGIGAAFIFTGGASSAPAPEAGSAGHVITVTETTSSAAGKMSVVIKYADRPHGRISISSLAFSAHSNTVIKHAFLEITLTPSVTGHKAHGLGAIIALSSPSEDRRNFTGSVPQKAFSPLNKGNGLTSGLQVVVSVISNRNRKRISLPTRPVLQEGVVLN
jgi:hypothetical protein